MIIVRLLLTAILVIMAVFGVTYVWTTYFAYPWTRDARVRADIVQVASYVSGEIEDIAVADNAAVEKGDTLIQIDRTSYRVAVEQAEAEVQRAEAQARRDAQQAERLTSLQDRDQAAVSEVEVTNAQLQADTSRAALRSARAQRESARVDLRRTTVTAPVDGYVANLSADTGDFASQGDPLIAILDEASFRIEAFFMETKLPEIRVDAPARIRLMASGAVLDGRVQGITRGIESGDAGSTTLLQNPQASFQWIRLARRIPVQIDIEERPEAVDLIAGATATVIVEPPPGEDDALARWTDWVGSRVTGFVAGLR